MFHKKLFYIACFAFFSVLLSSEGNSTSQFKTKENKSPGVSKSEPVYVTPASSPLYDTAGYTFYDLQALDRLQREMAIDSFGIVHAVWTKGLDSTSSVNGPREVYYSSWSANGSRLAHEVQVSETGARGGFPSIAVLPDGRTVCVYHHVNPLSGGRTDGLYASIEQTAGLGDFTGEIQLPDSVNGMGDAAMWPSCAAQMVDDSVVIHVVGIEGAYASGNRDFIYTRGVESSQDTFTFSPAQRPDSSNDMSVIVVASRKSNKVAIVYSRQKSFGGLNTDADIFYIESTEGGRDWVNGFENDIRDTVENVTKYQPGDPVRASGDLSAVYDEDDSLHIVWIAPLYSAGATASECYIFHWSKATGIDQVADGTFLIPDAGLYTYSNNLDKVQIGVHDGTGNLSRKNYLYVTWSQFGPGTSDASIEGVVNGEIYVNVSTNNGNTWGSPINITNSQTPGCDRNCDSDVWPTLAERLNDTLHILYINDKSTGSIVSSQGDPVLNPVLYYKYPAFSDCPDYIDCLSSVYPPVFEDPVLPPNGVMDTSFKIVICQPPETLKIDSIRTKGSSWLQILNLTDTILVGECLTIQKITVNIRLDATGLSPSTYIDTIIVYNNSNNNPRLRLPVHLVVTDCGYFRRSQVIAEVGDLKVKFANTSNLSDQDLLNGFYLTSTNKNFLYDGSAVVTTITADGDTVTLLDINAITPVRPLSGIDTHFVNLPDTITYTQALQQQRPAKGGNWLKIGPVYDAMFYPNIKPGCPWPGPWFKYWICQSWWIKVQPKPRYVIWFTKLYKADPPCWWPVWPGELLVNNIYAGSVLDWDVPSDTGGVINHWGNNDTLKFCWLQGDGPNSDDFFAATVAMVDISVHIGNPNGFWSAKVHRNAEFFPDDPKIIYRTISDSGFNPKDTLVDSLAFRPADRHIQFASICFDTTTDTVTYCQVLVVSDSGYDGLKKNVFNARLDMSLDHIDCFYSAGDANKSGNLTLTDIILLVNHVFKGAPKPVPACLGDCNNSNSIDLTDIVTLVKHIFRGGPRPAPDVDGHCCR